MFFIALKCRGPNFLLFGTVITENRSFIKNNSVRYWVSALYWHFCSTRESDELAILCCPWYQQWYGTVVTTEPTKRWEYVLISISVNGASSSTSNFKALSSLAYTPDALVLSKACYVQNIQRAIPKANKSLRNWTKCLPETVWNKRCDLLIHFHFDYVCLYNLALIRQCFKVSLKIRVDSLFRIKIMKVYTPVNLNSLSPTTEKRD